jgi:hypothetical protein
LIERTRLPGTTARWLCGYLGEFRGSLVMTFDKVGPDGEDPRGAMVVEKLEELQGSIARWMVVNEPYIAHVVPIERALEGEDPIQMMVCGTMERMGRAWARLLEHPKVSAAGVEGKELVEDAEVTLQRTEYPERDLCIVDILPAGCSKGSALRRLAARRGIRMEEILAIGDNWNDMSMLESAGRAVLMANAPQELRERAAQMGWSVGRRFNEDGVAVAIEAALEEAVTRSLELG